MGGAVVKSINGSKKPEVYFELELYPSLKDMFDVLALTYEESLKLFHAFMEMDKKNTGTIELGSFYKYYALKPTKFSDRVFTFLDKDASGKLDFREYCLGIWNYCTYDVRQMARVAFSFFDVEKIGMIDMADVDALFRMVYNTEESDWDKILTIFGKEGRDDRLNLTLELFLERIAGDPKLLQPALELQRVMRRKTFGADYWTKQQERRAVEFKSYDEGAEDEWGGLMDVIAAKKRDAESDTRPPEAAEPDPLAKYVIPEEERFLELQAKTRLILRREKKEFSERKVDGLRAAETEGDERERQAWSRLTEAKRLLHETRYTLDQVDDRTRARNEMWEALDDVMEKVRKLTRTKEEMAIELARGPDAEAKCDLYLSSALGKKRYDFELITQYGNLLREGFHANAVLALFSGVFDAPPGQVTWATAAVYKYARTKRMLEAAGDRARRKICDEIIEKDYLMIKRTYADKNLSAENDFNHMADQMTTDYGSRRSRWEILWDEELQMEYLFHLDTRERIDNAPAVAICETCDAHIMDEDSKCLGCGSARSAKNKLLHRGLSLALK